MTFEIITPQARAYAITEDDALFTARTLTDDAVKHGASLLLVRREIVVTRNRMYDSGLTARARKGDS